MESREQPSGDHLPRNSALEQQTPHQGQSDNNPDADEVELLVRLISHQDGPTAIWALTRALIGGAQPISGWWAPVALRNKRRWGPAAHGMRFTYSRVSPPSKTLVRSVEGA
jgi:hypothetical protein